MSLDWRALLLPVFSAGVLAFCPAVLFEATAKAGKTRQGTIMIKEFPSQLVYHNDSLTGPNDHFGCLLLDAGGHLKTHAATKTWLYTGSLADGKWASFARELDIETLAVGPKTPVLPNIEGEEWATIHLVIQASEDLFVAFYSTGRHVRAAVGPTPLGPFERDPHFAILPTEPWEQGCSLESDPGAVAIRDDANETRFWKLYDTLGPGTRGANGWAEVRIDKRARAVELVRKHPGNPLRLLLPDRFTARTGGTADASLRIGGKYPLFYLSKPNQHAYRLALALSADPLHQSVVSNEEIGEMMGGETVFEKFQCYARGNHLTILYELAHRDGDWRTGVRKYRLP